jgi:phosphate transport system substrate-binding protein
MIKKLSLLIILACVLISCTSNNASKNATDDAAKNATGNAPAKKIAISGAWALYPMMTVWADEYKKKYPDITVDVSAGGAGKGATDVLANMVDIGMISREAQPDEIEKGGFFVPVTKDAVVPTISDKNPVIEDLKQKGIGKAIFERIFINADISTWGEVVGTSAKQPLRAYTRSDSCGAAESWAKFFGKKQENLKGTGVYGDPGLLEAVRKDALGIGYNNYSYVFDMKTGNMIPGVSVVFIDVNNNGTVDANEVIDTRDKLKTAIRTGVYPHPPARPLYLMTKGKPSGPEKDFILWILTDGQAFVENAGYMVLPEDMIKKALQDLKNTG